MLKILHIAPLNYAGVPYSFFDMHLKCGDYSRLITLHKNPQDFPEDICLHLPLPMFSLAKSWRKKKVSDTEIQRTKSSIYFEPKNIFEKLYFGITDYLRKGTVEQTIEDYKLNDFDVVHYDAGLDFFRNSSQAKKWKQQGKKIVSCFYGSDLRIRGLIREMDALSDLNITSEYDHLAMKKDLHYVFYPYNPSELPSKKNNSTDRVRIIHTPTNRKYKGTDLILSVIEKLKREKKIDFVLMENMPRAEVLEEKSKCDICIDQVGGKMGGTGYGKAGLETLAMGIPTITNMTKDYEDWLPENAFTVANNADELYIKLNELIDSEELRKVVGERGNQWVHKYHGYDSVNRRLYELYRQHHII